VKLPFHIGTGLRTSLPHAAGLLTFATAALLALFPLSIATDASANDMVRIAHSERAKSVNVARGKPLTVRTDIPFQEIVVGDPEIANVNPLTNRSFYILGNRLGTTGIALFDENKQLVGSIDVEVTLDTNELSNSIRQSVPGADVSVSSANGRLVISGSARDAVAAQQVQQIATHFSNGEEIVNSLKVTSSQQVQLQVRFIEASREAQRNLGVQLGAVSYGLPRSIGGAGTISSGSGINLGDVLGSFIGNGVSVDVLIQAMENRGVARTLAEPNLIARSGETASFLAGGEFPIPISNVDNTVTVEFKKFGVGLDFTPQVLDDGLISLQIEPEVSQIDLSSSYRIGDISIPGFSVRRAKTSVDLRSGQSFVIAGLLQTQNQTTTDRVPGLGNLPILGALFSSKQYLKRETDLIIIVTPHLVHPITAGTPIATPLDGTLPPTPAEFALGGVEEVHTSSTTAITVPESLATTRRLVRERGQGGHILDLPTGRRALGK
jgi:pilus assembly protein CpaC